jgi:ferritin-like metal-binding protein YciE
LRSCTFRLLPAFAKPTARQVLRLFLSFDIANPQEDGEPRLGRSAKPSYMRLTSLKLESVEDLFLAELRDLYDAENQLLKALPKLAEAASAPSLKLAFSRHLEETKGHVGRLDRVFRELDVKPSGETCEAMKGLVKEGEEFIQAKGEPSVRDAGLIGAAQRVEHYEMAGYGTARTLAKRLGFQEIATTLQQTLEEEGEADRKLTAVAENEVNVKAIATAP